MQAFLQSFLLVTVAEMGDKTQLLALLLTARFRQPWAILGGIFCATVLNHLLAGWAGTWLAGYLTPSIQRWGLAGVFVAFGLWMLIPDKADDEPTGVGAHGAFLTTLVTFFLAEMGDKTQLATVALAAEFRDLVMVTMGTTLGMMVADGLAVILGERLTRRIPMALIHRIAAGLFILTGIGVAFF